jgi:hypothetical protein
LHGLWTGEVINEFLNNDKTPPDGRTFHNIWTGEVINEFLNNDRHHLMAKCSIIFGKGDIK